MKVYDVIEYDLVNCLFINRLHVNIVHFYKFLDAALCKLAASDVPANVFASSDNQFLLVMAHSQTSYQNMVHILRFFMILTNMWH